MKISILYHHFPHYRAPVMRALAQSQRHEYHFFGGLEDHEGIRAFRGDDLVRINPIAFVQDGRKGRIDIRNFDRAVSKEFDAAIILGNMRMPGVWKAAGMARRNGLGTAFWAHGWLRREPWPKRRIRNYFFRKTDLVLTYGARAVQIARASGFPTERIRVIWNSLDWERHSTLFERYKSLDRDVLRQSLGMPTGVPLILTVSRVTDLCRYDWLVEAVAALRRKGSQAGIWMIGDGPALPGLIAQAASLGVPLYSRGAQYEEDLLVRQIMAADVVASPGKVGLTAMHALACGTPVVTHSDLDRQMPEVEAIIDGVSGAFFRFGDIGSLAEALDTLTGGEAVDYAEQRGNCRAALEGRFTPRDQARLIDDAMDEISNAKKR